MDLSVIIPVYNTAKDKLERCFESVTGFCKAGADSNVEINCLIVNDGSKQETADFCKLYADSNPYFIFINKENGGVSSARNCGIDNARSKYICFVDSDDVVCYEAFPFNRLNEEYDLVFTDIRFVTHGHESIWSAFSSSGEINNSKVIGRFVQDGTINGPVCKIIKADFLDKHNIRFDTDMIIGEDFCFLASIIANNPKMYYEQVVTYIYYFEAEASNSRMLNNIHKYVDNNIRMYHSMIGLIETNELGDTIRLRADERFIKQMFNISAELVCYKKHEELDKGLLETAISQLNSKDVDLINRQSGFKSKTQLKLMKKKSWKTIALIGRMRFLYLKLKDRFRSK